jgi:hypothetical protein
MRAAAPVSAAIRGSSEAVIFTCICPRGATAPSCIVHGDFIAEPKPLREEDGTRDGMPIVIALEDLRALGSEEEGEA